MPNRLAFFAVYGQFYRHKHKAHARADVCVYISAWCAIKEFTLCMNRRNQLRFRDLATPETFYIRSLACLKRKYSSTISKPYLPKVILRKEIEHSFELTRIHISC